MATPLPASFGQLGFKSPQQVLPKHRRLMLSIYGDTNTGKSAFALSAPGPGLFLTLDRGIEGLLRSESPSPYLNTAAFAFNIVEPPNPAMNLSKESYGDYWQKFYTSYRAALDNKDARTVVLDGDSDSWELQRMAEFGRLAQVPQNLYTNANAARRLMYARAYDSGKIFIATSRVRKVYETKYGPDGKPMMNTSGNEIRMWNGEFERQGFADQNYLWQVHAMTLYNEKEEKFGLKIEMCKFQRSLEGFELWGEDCNFQGLVQTIFPTVPLSEWGYK